MNFTVVKEFEDKIAKFYGAPYAVAVDCCTHAIELCLRHTKPSRVTFPNRTYISIPFLGDKLGIEWDWDISEWDDSYTIGNTNIVDAAVLWREGSYTPKTLMCLSFQFQKHLNLGRGGMILTDDKEAAEALKKMSYDGRLPDKPWREQDISSMGYHYYITPETAQQGLHKLEEAKERTPKKWVWEDWPDLRHMKVFKKPKITTIITTYYRPDLLARAMRSVQLQTFEEFECIVFADHCPAARKVYENYFSDDPRFIFVDNPEDWVKNVGAVGHNYALDNASSDIITYLCDDNIFLPNHLETVYNNISDDIGLVKTEAFHLVCGSGDGSVKAIVDRDFYSDFHSVEGFSSCCDDLIRIGHKIKKSPRWIPWCESGTNNEDHGFLNSVSSQFKEKHVETFTGFYYARGASKIRDASYHEAVSNLADDEIFVYPEITERIFDDDVI